MAQPRGAHLEIEQDVINALENQPAPSACLTKRFMVSLILLNMLFWLFPQLFCCPTAFLMADYDQRHQGICGFMSRLHLM
ncbi:hypothetical protein EXN66_Car015291 [Channa argus]|uniref:Uncharacterized protein n=1 Tax=Channa argus TaxID=215402 RepID=A0A6G1QB06_CHAAH|nr:hypothetical protein EXN66_Car015291 [Channa argus]